MLFLRKRPLNGTLYTLNHCKNSAKLLKTEYCYVVCPRLLGLGQAWAGSRGFLWKEGKVFMATRKTWMSGPYVLSRVRWVIKKEMVTVYHPSMTMRQRVQKISKTNLLKTTLSRKKESMIFLSQMESDICARTKKWKMNKFQGLEVITRNK